MFTSVIIDSGGFTEFEGLVVSSERTLCRLISITSDEFKMRILKNLHDLSLPEGVDLSVRYVYINANFMLCDVFIYERGSETCYFDV